ncbi:F-box/WD repeat-containing protein 1A [Leucoagaricus sp. SymC.cos]|nr:F-box/WD repeat-containing protein 1A [Leucoagaricus sp. SymC.cos]
MLNSVLGSPFLTTADLGQTPSHLDLDSNEAEERRTHRSRPPSPTPTADYSIIDADELEGDNPPLIRIPGSYPYGHRRPMSSSFAGFGIQSPATWSTSRGRSTYYATSGISGAPFMSLNHPTESISMPSMSQQSNPFKTLLPRIWDALSSPGKTFSGNHNSNSSPSSSSTSINSSPAGSPRIFSHSISLPTGLISTQSPTGRQSPLLWNTHSRAQNKGKGRAQPSTYSLFTSEPTEDVDFSELSPLDGEEGELVDEACFVDVRAVTGVDILRLLPSELGVYILQLLCPSPLFRHSSSAARLDPLSSEIEQESEVALRAMLACLSVSHTWRRLASDNSVWHSLFLGRWDVDLRRADASHMRKPGSRNSTVNIVESPNRQLKRHRWKLKPKAQVFKFGGSSKLTASSCARPQSSSSSLLVPKVLRQPKQNFPLQFDWKRMYMERLELEKRWLGTAYTQVPIMPLEEPQCTRETRRSMAGRAGPRSRWEPETKELRGHTDSVYCVEFDSKRIITGSRDRTIMVWSLKTGRLLGTFVGAHTGSVLCLKFEKDWDLSSDRDMDLEDSFASPMKKTGLMFTGSSDCTERMVDRDRRVLAEPIAALKGHTGGVLDLRIDSRWIVSCSKDTVIRVWDRKTLTLHRMLRGHEGPVNAVGLQNDRVVSASGDGKMILWDIESGERLRTFEGHDRGLACIDFKNELIVSGSNDCKVRVWNAQTGECLRTLAGHNALVRAISFDPKTGRLLSASYDKVVKVWDLYSGKLIREFKYTHTSHIFDVKFNLGRIVSASHDQRICVLDFTTGLNAAVFI